MKNIKNIPTPLIVAAILVALLALLPLAFPYGWVKPKVEVGIGKLIHGKVEIGDINFSYSPAPVFTLERVQINSADDAVINRVVIPMSARNLLSFGNRFYGVILDGVTLSRKFAMRLPEQFAPEGKPDIRVDNVKLENVTVKLDKTTLGPITGLLEFKEDGRADKLTIPSDDGKMMLEIQPAKPGSFKVIFSAKDWALPFGHPVQFDYVNLIGTSDSEVLQVSDISAGLYNGVITGNAELRWGDTLTLGGAFKAKNLRAESLISVFSPITRATGILSGEGQFRYEATQHTQLFQTPQLQAQFLIQNGMLHNIDLISPLKSPPQETVRHGGQTNYDTLSGQISLRDGIVNMSRVRLNSGKFQADGELSIRQGQLSGGAAATLSAGAIQVSNRVNLLGTLAAPGLRAGGAWRPRSEETAVKSVW